MKKKDPLEGRVIYVLVLTVLVQFLYPLSIGDNPIRTVAFQIFYLSLFVASIYLVANTPFYMRLLSGLSIVWLIVGATATYNPDLQWANVSGYGVFIAGPSKTADIEQSLVIGAQGARSLTIVFID